MNTRTKQQDRRMLDYRSTTRYPLQPIVSQQHAIQRCAGRDCVYTDRFCMRLLGSPSIEYVSNERCPRLNQEVEE